MGSPGIDPLSSPTFLQLAGHPLRWRLLRELARGDRMVHELTGLLDQPQNLVSYHLGKLRQGGLVTTRRSSADGRDAYYAADLAQLRTALAATGAALHPGLLPRPAPGDAADVDHPAATEGTVRLLFLCTGNSGRSQMAEALVRVRSSGTVEACSAGSHPKALHPDAVRVMRERGIDLTAQRPKHLDVFADERFDRVISLCDRVREVCPERPGRPELTHWSMADPAAAGGDDEASHRAFRRTADELETRIGFLLAALGRPPTTRASARHRVHEEETS